MSYSAEPHRSTGDFITAAIWNQAASDNPAAIYSGAMAIPSQADGDVIKAISATQLGRVALGVLGQSLGVAAGPVLGYINSGRSKLNTFSRSNSAADGNQAVTGVGFLPAVVLFIGGVQAVSGTVGVMTASVNACIYWDFASVLLDNTRVAWVYEAAGVFNRATKVSLDADGFTVAWVKSGGPSGTSSITYLALG